MRRTQLSLVVVLAAAFMMGWLGFVPSAHAYDTCQQYHTVLAGENLFRISLHYGTTVTTLASLNQITNSNFIFVGQHLCVAGTGGGSTPVPPTQATYTVQRGDTLWSIARRFNIPPATLAQVNNIANANLIYVGQVLRIPSSTTNNDVVIPTPPQYVVALVAVNLRSGPGFNFAVEGRMRVGEQAHVTGASADGQWWRVVCAVDASSNCWVSANPAFTQVVGLPQYPG